MGILRTLVSILPFPAQKLVKGTTAAGIAAAIYSVPFVAATGPAYILLPVLTGAVEGVLNWWKHRDEK